MGWPSKDYRDYLGHGSGLGSRSVSPRTAYAFALLYLGVGVSWIAWNDDASSFVIWLGLAILWLAIGVRASIRRRKRPPNQRPRGLLASRSG